MGDAAQEKPAPDRAPEPAPRDDVRLLRSPHRCPFCHESVDAAEADQVACRACLARHHGECWREAGRCSACAGAEALSATAPAPRSRRGPLLALGVALVAGAALAAALVASRPRTFPPLDLSGPKEAVTARVRLQAEAGDPAAMNLLGFRLLTGQGCVRDEAQAFRWGLRAAEAGHAEAMFGVATLLEQGRGTSRDERAAAAWYRRAVAAGDTMAGPALERLLARRPDLR